MEGRRMTTGAETVVETKDKNTWDLYGPAQRRTFLFILFLTGTANYADRNVIGVLLEPIKADFVVSDPLLVLLPRIAFSVFFFPLGLPLPFLSDPLNRLRVISL